MRPTVQWLSMCSPSDATLDGVNGDKKLPSVWLQIAYTHTHIHVHIVIDTAPCSPTGGKLLQCFRCLNFLCLFLLFDCHNVQCCNVHRVAQNYRSNFLSPFKRLGAGVGDADVVLVVVVVTVVVLVVLVVTVVVTVVTDVFDVAAGDVNGTTTVVTPNEAVEVGGGDVTFNVTLLQFFTAGIRYEPNKPA